MENKFFSQFPKYPAGNILNPLNLFLLKRRNLFVNRILSKERQYNIPVKKAKIESFIVGDNTLITRVFYGNSSHLKELIFKHTISDISDYTYSLKNSGVIFCDYEVFPEELSHLKKHFKTLFHNKKEYYLYQKLDENINKFISNSPYDRIHFINRLESESEINKINIYEKKSTNNEFIVSDKKIFKIDSDNSLKLNDYDLKLVLKPFDKDGFSSEAYIRKISDENFFIFKNNEKSILLSKNTISYKYFSNCFYFSFDCDINKSNYEIETGIKSTDSDNGTLFSFSHCNDQMLNGIGYNSIMFSPTTVISSFDNHIFTEEGVEVFTLLTDMEKKLTKKHIEHYNILLSKINELNFFKQYCKDIDFLKSTIQLEILCKNILPVINKITNDISVEIKNKDNSNKLKKY